MLLDNPYEDLPEVSQEMEEFKVTRDLPVSLSYPCIILPSTLQVDPTSMNVLSKIMTSQSEGTLQVYLEDESLLYLGSINRASISVFIDLIPDLSQSQVYLNKDHPISHKYLLALS